MANAYFYSNTAAETSLAGSIGAGATTVSVVAVTGFPVSYPYILALDFGGTAEELVKVTAASDVNLTVERGFGGTSAQSHSIGAKVRHVVNAVDLTDFRTHEDGSTGVHGLTGDVVGTSDTQSVANKTFGTDILFTGTPISESGSAGNAVFRARVTGDGNYRLQVGADGQLYWGDGTATWDTVLYREETSTLTTDDIFRVYRSATTGDAISIRVDGDTASRLLIEADGSMFWGTGSTAVDTNLYRSSNDVLRTDDTFLAANMRAGRDQTPAPGAGGGQTSVAVTFTSAMSGTPRITATPNSTATDLDATNIRWAITDESATGFTLNCYRTTNFATNFDWVAISDTE